MKMSTQNLSNITIFRQGRYRVVANPNRRGVRFEPILIAMGFVFSLIFEKWMHSSGVDPCSPLDFLKTGYGVTGENLYEVLKPMVDTVERCENDKFEFKSKVALEDVSQALKKRRGDLGDVWEFSVSEGSQRGLFVLNVRSTTTLKNNYAGSDMGNYRGQTMGFDRIVGYIEEHPTACANRNIVSILGNKKRLILNNLDSSYNSVNPSALISYLSLDNTFMDAWTCRLSLQTEEGLGTQLNIKLSPNRRTKGYKKYNMKVGSMLDKIRQQIDTDVPWILENGYADEISKNDFDHAHIILSSEETEPQVLILYHTREYISKKTINNKHKKMLQKSKGW